MTEEVQDVVHFASDGLWYFWDELGAYRIGPYISEERARQALKAYCKYLATGEKEAEHD